MKFDEEHAQIIARGVWFFNKEFFWECHEELEHWWLEDMSPIRYVYWAVIQAAACLYHYDRKNLEGAVGLWEKCLAKIKKVEESHIESDLLEQNLSWTKFKLEIRKIKGSSLSDFESLRCYKFLDFSFDKYSPEERIEEE